MLNNFFCAWAVIRVHHGCNGAAIDGCGFRWQAVNTAHLFIQSNGVGFRIIFPDADLCGIFGQLHTAVNFFQPFFCFFTLSYVNVGTCHAQGTVIFIPFHDPASIHYPDPMAVFMTHAEFKLITVDFSAPVSEQHVFRFFEVIRMNESEPGIDPGRSQLFEGIAKNFCPAFVEYGAAIRDVPVP